MNGDEPELLGASLLEGLGQDFGATGGAGAQEIGGVVQADGVLRAVGDRV